MLASAFMIFFISLIFGLLFLDETLKGRSTARTYAYWHGPIAFIGIGILAFAIYYGEQHSTILTSLYLFLFAALTGLVLFILDMFKKSLPKWLVIIHVMTGLIAIAILLFYIVTHKKSSINIYAKKGVNNLVVVTRN